MPSRDEKKRGRPKSDKPESKIVSTRFEGELLEAWEEYIASCVPDVTDAAALRAAAKQFLSDKGFWPRRKKQPPADK
jgi:hypothetical protein